MTISAAVANSSPWPNLAAGDSFAEKTDLCYQHSSWPMEKFFCGIIDTDEQFIAVVVDTAEQFIVGVNVLPRVGNIADEIVQLSKSSRKHVSSLLPSASTPLFSSRSSLS